MTVTDTIFIRDLLVRGIIGLNDWERENKQDIIVNIEIPLDARQAGESDNMEDSINYRTLTKAVIAHVEGSEPYLVEALAHEIARIAIVGHGCNAVKVRVEKPGALRFARSVGVEVKRTPADFG